ncbi:MAG: hypothetical protein FWE71_11745 [Nocardioidaceae bacterium]|nr:hypothetical protein [Nocardioidaceae bacterium]MCL2613736.1 hypothetical protein [Nocardioidaceae bacterium]
MNSDDRSALVRDFVARARWFGGKGRRFSLGALSRVASVDDDDGLTVVVELAEVRYEQGESELYQLPLSLYPEPQQRLEHAAVGTWEDPDLGTVHAYDAVHDSDAMHLLLHAGGDATWHRLPGCPELGEDVHATAFAGEQSNSSVLFGEEAVLKVFRKVTPGENPDITTHRALTEAGSTHVAMLYGWLEHEGVQLAMLQEFLRTASDGWDLALASVRNLYAEADRHAEASTGMHLLPHPDEDIHADELGGDFAGEAARLGAALGEVHEQLRAAFPVATLPARDVVAGMRERLTATAAAVPELASYVAPLAARYDALLAVADLPVQRVHGDLHLGQTLRTVSGWRLVDFEGEPAKPLAERLRPDTPWRDVAGMLRSFDYAAHALLASQDEQDPDLLALRRRRAREWTTRNVEAFLTAYVGGDPSTLIPARQLTPDEDAIITAYVADKAVYECLYEARNRPTWLDIPLDAIARLVG